MPSRHVVCIAIAIVLSACDQPLSTRGLAARCTQLYEDVDTQLLSATKSFLSGESAPAVLTEYSPRIEAMVRETADLRHDLAVGGERNRWEWPLVVRSEAIVRYESRVGGVKGDIFSLVSDADGNPLPEDHDNWITLPDELAMLGQIGRSDLDSLGWFCNRPVSALMPPVSPEDFSGIDGRLTLLEQSHASFEILMAIETEEELSAYLAYQRRVDGDL